MAEVGALCVLDRAGGYRAACGLFGAEAADIAAFLDIARLLYDGPWLAEYTAALREVVVGRPGIMHPVTRAIVAAGPERRTVDAFDAFHALAGVRRLAAELFGKYDALLLPTAPFCPTLAELAANPVGPNARLGIFTNFVNLCDLAAIAVPAGFGADGMPVGVTVLGPAWAEGRLAAIADHVHRSLSAGVPDAAPADVLADDETTLFCIGAHVSGLGLNGQVTSLGGRFLRAARTLPEYRPHALGARPGMLRAGRQLRARSGRCRRLRSARCWRKCRRRWVLHRGAGGRALPGLPGRGARARARAGCHRAWWLAGVAGGRGRGVMTDQELDAFMDSSAMALGIAVDPEWCAAVRANLAVVFRMDALMLDFPLDDAAEPGPVIWA